MYSNADSFRQVIHLLEFIIHIFISCLHGYLVMEEEDAAAVKRS